MPRDRSGKHGSPRRWSGPGRTGPGAVSLTETEAGVHVSGGQTRPSERLDGRGGGGGPSEEMG